MTTAAHKNKTLATLLALLLGGAGMHRFYLGGLKDKWGWLHLSTLPISFLLASLYPEAPLFYTAGLLILSILISFIETLVIGLKPDDKWDQLHNPDTGRQSDSKWPLALLLVITLGVGATSLIAALARFFDLLFTGGAFG